MISLPRNDFLFGLSQARYGWAKDQVRRDVDDWLDAGPRTFGPPMGNGGSTPSPFLGVATFHMAHLLFAGLL